MNEGDFPLPQTIRAAPGVSAAALEGVRYRRVVAVGLDFFLVSMMSAAIFVGLFVLSFGMSAFLLPPLLPLVAFFYNGLTVSGPRMATPGMALMDLEMRTTAGAPVEFLQAAVHAVLFYVSWLFPPVLIVSLFAHDKRCLHDMLSEVIVLRRTI